MVCEAFVIDYIFSTAAQYDWYIIWRFGKLIIILASADVACRPDFIQIMWLKQDLILTNADWLTENYNH